MLKEVILKNYRCFENTSFSLKDLVVIVGKNNSGKSTIIEALRLLSLAGNKSKTSNYIPTIESLGLPLNYKGLKLDVQKLKIDLRGIVHFYKNVTAQVIATFVDNTRIEIYINEDIAFAVIFNEKNKIIFKKKEAQDYAFDCVSILPQIGLIKENEKILTEATVISDKDSYLSSRHFRNELLLFKKEFFDEFKETAEKTWKGLRIRELEYDFSKNDTINLFVEDDGFSSEIGLMGSGLQMWLQIIWFLCRSKNAKTIILDEPDVYMHPDLQRKILNISRRSFKQIIIATHSIEIISEVNAENVINIDKNEKKLRYADSMNGVQSIVDDIGGVQNLSLIRIGTYKKCIFVEGNDLKILSKIAKKIYPDLEIDIDILPNISLGGWTRLQEAFGASKLFYDETKGQIKTICILDRDYYPQNVLDEKLKIAFEQHLELIIWEKKEIENYLIIPKVIFRLTSLTEEFYSTFLDEFEKLLNEYYNTVFDSVSHQFHQSNKGWDVSKCNEESRKYVDSNWCSMEGKIKLISGKDLISKINKWMNDKYKTHCSINRIINNLVSDDVSDEMKKVIKKLI